MWTINTLALSPDSPNGRFYSICTAHIYMGQKHRKQLYTAELFVTHTNVTFILKHTDWLIYWLYGIISIYKSLYFQECLYFAILRISEKCKFTFY